MTLHLPETVRSALGDAATGDFLVWMEDVMDRRVGEPGCLKRIEDGVVDNNAAILGVNKRVGSLEAGVGALQTGVSGFDKRVGGLEIRMGGVETRLGEVSEDLRSLRTTIDDRFDRQWNDFNTRFDGLSARLDDRLDRFWVDVDKKFDAQDARFDARFDRLEDRLTSQTRWSVGLIALFGTMITVITLLGP